MPQETPQRPTMVAARFNDACRRLPRCLPQKCRSGQRPGQRYAPLAFRKPERSREGSRLQKKGHAVRLSELTVFAGQKSDASWTRASQRPDRDGTRVGQRPDTVRPGFGPVPAMRRAPIGTQKGPETGLLQVVANQGWCFCLSEL
jgi:hypothetical protein